ncbi:MAG: ATP-binding protein [Pseudomonadota bacterium]
MLRVLMSRLDILRGGYTAPPKTDLWRSLLYFNVYRMSLATVFVGLSFMLGVAPLFVGLSALYLVLAGASLPLIYWRRPYFDLQLGVQIGTDIVLLTLLSQAGGGMQVNLEMLLLVSLAAAGLISRGRVSLFFASLASIAILLQHSYAVLTKGAEIERYVQVALLCVAYFAVAWMAHRLAQYAIASEKLAALREADLASLAEANQLVIQDMPDGVLVVDAQGVVRQYNPGVERLSGLTFPPNGQIALDNYSPALAGLYAQWRKDPSRDQADLRFSATREEVRVRFLPVRRDTFWGAVVLLEDMQHVQAQAQQVKLAALGRLTMNIAHEVRNPLSAIRYATDLLREDVREPADMRLLQIITDNAMRLDHIVQDVMELNRRDRVRPESMQLEAELPKFVEALCQAEGVEASLFHLGLHPGLQIRFDRGHFEQVLWNLCRNALRYCRKQPGSVRLWTWRAWNGRPVLEVVDDGPGVPPEQVSKLFEPFHTTDAGGTGLGLYIARELCAANGATLEYVQRAEGGACFRIMFEERVHED